MVGGEGREEGRRPGWAQPAHPGVGGDCVYTVKTVKLYGPVRKAKAVVDYLVFFLLCKHIMVIPGRPAPKNRPQLENGLDAVSPQTNKEARVHLSQQ